MPFYNASHRALSYPHKAATAIVQSNLKPNVLVFILDDFTMRDRFRSLRQIRGRNDSMGSTWTGSLYPQFRWYRMHAESNQCDPSRYTIYSGQTAAHHGVGANTLTTNFNWNPSTGGGSIFSAHRAAGYKLGFMGKLDHQALTTLPTTDIGFGATQTVDYQALHSTIGTGGQTNYAVFDIYIQGVLHSYSGGNTIAAECNNLGDVLGMGLPQRTRLESTSYSVLDSPIINPNYNATGNPAFFRDFLAMQDTNVAPWLCFINPPNPHLNTLGPVAPRFALNANGAQGKWWAGGSSFLPTNAAFNTTQSAPPYYIQNMGSLTSSQQTSIKGDERTMEQCSLQADDQMVLCIEAAKVQGGSRPLVVIVVSDQGLNLGEKTINEFKTDPYIHSNQMFFGIMAPGYSGGDFESSSLISNLDICPTICGLTGATMPITMDGINFLTNTRTSCPIHWVDGHDVVTTPTFKGVYTTDMMYVKYLSQTVSLGNDTNREELFDMAGTISGTPDWLQMTNREQDSRYASALASLRTLAG